MRIAWLWCDAARSLVRIKELTPEELLLQMIETDQRLPEVSQALGRALEAFEVEDDRSLPPECLN